MPGESKLMTYVLHQAEKSIVLEVKLYMCYKDMNKDLSRLTRNMMEWTMWKKEYQKFK